VFGRDVLKRGKYDLSLMCLQPWEHGSSVRLMSLTGSCVRGASL
jgi:hypothetical protein